MKASVVVALTGIAGLLVACSDDGNGTGQGGYSPGVLANVAVGTSATKASSTSTSTGEETTSTTTSSTTSSTASSTGASTSTGLISEPLFPYCGCITDNLSAAGLCQGCWDSAVAPKGACADLIAACGQACTDMLDALSTECGGAGDGGGGGGGGGVPMATPGCLQKVAQLHPNNVDDFAAVLDCICACPACDEEACM